MLELARRTQLAKVAELFFLPFVSIDFKRIFVVSKPGDLAAGEYIDGEVYSDGRQDEKR